MPCLVMLISSSIFAVCMNRSQDLRKTRRKPPSHAQEET